MVSRGILDTSAIVAIIKNEPERSACLAAMATADRLRIAAGTYVEATVVITRTMAPGALARFDQLMAFHDLEIVAMSAEHVRLARDAYLRFGQKSSSPAKLNFGDCFAYALAKAAGEPLLFKGEDFRHTDLVPALPG